MTKLSVSELTIYPLKSAKGLSLQSIELNKLGPECDRRWMVIDQNKKFVTQRTTPKMCLINTELVDGELYISADNADRCQLPAGGAELYESSVWGSKVKGNDCGKEAARWISAFLGKECRIIYMHETDSRLVDTNFATQNEQLGFADGFPLLISTQASLDDFNSKLSSVESASPEKSINVSMSRFRPNIVITGTHAWVEDTWQKILINGIELSLVKPCSRCIMPSINPKTGEKQMEVNQTLLKHRRRNGETYFGQNAIYNTFGSIGVGDEVVIIK